MTKNGRYATLVSGLDTSVNSTRNNMNKVVKKILDLLPFNGEKLKISLWWLVFTGLPQIIPGADIAELLKMIAENPTKSGIVAAILALLHKKLKIKFPTA